MFQRIFTLCFIVNVSVSAWAASISTLLQRADAVVLATASSETQSGNQVAFSLDVERVFVGPIRVGQIVPAQTPAETRSPVRLTENRAYRGIWFLKAATNGGWESIQAWHQGNGSVAMSYFRYPVGTGPLPPALAYDAASTPVADQILLEMSAGDLEGRPDLIMDASGDMSSPAVQRALHYLADSGTGDKALIGLAGLVGHGEVASLLRAETMALSLTGNTGGPGYIISAIGNVRLTDPVAVACLGRMATTQSNSVLLRDRSAHALAAIHTVDAVPWLGKLLSDPSNALKLIGATGMSFFVNGVGIPTPETMLSLSHLNQRSPSPYRTTGTDQHIGYALGQEGSFVDFWTSWWNEHPELRSQN